MDAKIERLNVKTHSRKNGSFQAAIEDFMAFSGIKMEKFAIIAWYEGGIIVKNITPDTLDNLDQFVHDELMRAYDE